jgi:acyl-CoA synthetase (AMP-forming)/AMP-acid ligase II
VPRAGDGGHPATATTVPEFINAMSAAFGDTPAVVLGEEVLTYRGLDEQSARLAAGLLARGVGKGAHIGMLAANCPRWAVWWAAISRIGAVAVPLTTFAKPPELARMVRHGDLHGIVCQSGFLGQDFVGNVEAAFPPLADSSPGLRLPDAPFLRWIVVERSEPPAWARPLSWLEAARDDFGAGDLLRSAEAQVHPDEPAIMIYTSGQSAGPKGVLHSHRGIMGKTHYLREMFCIGSTSRSRATMPFFWVGGLVVTLLTTLEAGGTVVCLDGATTGGTIVGAGGRSQSVGMFGPARLHPGLGQTESFGMYSFGTDAPDPRRPLCTPLSIFDPEVEIKIVDPAGHPVPDGGRGEILVRGRGITLGLQKVARSEVFDADGYYRTGDEGEIDGDVIYFLGRLGDMIKTSGANVSPAEVEQEMAAIDGVAAAYVVALDDIARGQVVVAAVVPEPGGGLDAETVVAALRPRLSSYKVPRMIAFFSRDELPVTPSNKLIKRVLAEMIQAQVEGVPIQG